MVDIGVLGCSRNSLGLSYQHSHPRPSALSQKMGSIDTNQSPLTHLAQQLRLSPTLQINELVQKKQAEGCRVVHLGFGEATFPIEKNVLKTHREACEETSYLPVAGLMKLLLIVYCQISGTPPWGSDPSASGRGGAGLKAPSVRPL